MLRAIVAVSSAVALQLAALAAPLVHAHLDDHHDGHHGGARVHAHLGGHETEGSHHLAHAGNPAVSGDQAPEQATSLQLFVAEQRLPFAIPSLPPARFRVAPPLESILPRPPSVAHSHDPPATRSASPRAPPVSSL